MDDMSDCEKSERADRRLEDFIKGLQLDEDDRNQLLYLAQRASTLAFEAGIEHQTTNHSCPHRCGSAFG
jgi:hypothetical protein